MLINLNSLADDRVEKAFKSFPTRKKKKWRFLSQLRAIFHCSNCLKKALKLFHHLKPTIGKKKKKKSSYAFRQSTINNFVGLYPLFPFLPALPRLHCCPAARLRLAGTPSHLIPSLRVSGSRCLLGASSTLHFSFQCLPLIAACLFSAGQGFFWCFLLFLFKVVLPLFCSASLLLSLLSIPTGLLLLI